MSEKVIKEKKNEKGGRATSYFVNFLIFTFVIILVVNCISVFKRMNDKKKKYNEIKAQYEQALVQKSEYEYLLDEDNQLEYIERIAREKYGYISPGERAFYDSSLGK